MIFSFFDLGRLGDTQGVPPISTNFSGRPYLRLGWLLWGWRSYSSCLVGFPIAVVYSWGTVESVVAYECQVRLLKTPT